MANRDTSFIDSIKVSGNRQKPRRPGLEQPRLKRSLLKGVKFSGNSGAGEGIRTLDPNLGNLNATLFGCFFFYATAL
jgi:hypothetical protein